MSNVKLKSPCAGKQDKTTFETWVHEGLKPTGNALQVTPTEPGGFLALAKKTAAGFMTNLKENIPQKGGPHVNF